MRFLLAIVASFLLVGCSADPVDPQPPPPPVAPPPPPAAEPPVDTTFMDQASVEAWRAVIATYIQGEAAVPHPRDIWRYASDFHVDRNKPDPFLGDPSIWDATSVIRTPIDMRPEVATMPRPDEALALEAQDEEWAAAQLWIVLGRMDDAKRCSDELEKEGEWKAVALIAVHTGDLAVLDRATSHMVDGNQISRTQEVAQYAFSQGKVDVAKHIAHAHGWNLSEVLSLLEVRSLALKGDTSLLIEILDQEIAAWESGDLWSLGEYPPPVTIVADIAILGKTQQAKAREYAARYLKLPSANVFLWTECGEGCYSSPVAGTLELYQLVAADKTLRELYFVRLRQAIDYMFPRLPHPDQRPTTTIAGLDSDTYSGFGEDMWGIDRNIGGNYLYAYLQRIRTIGDRELTAFWIEMLASFPQRSGWNDDQTLTFEREVGRYTLGLPFYKSVGKISATEKFVLEELFGGANRKMDDTWAAWDKELPGKQRIEEVEYLFYFLTRGSVPASREAAIRKELGIETTPGEEESLKYELPTRFRRSLDAHYGEAWVLNDRFGRVGHALRVNAEAQRLRGERSLPTIELYPDTDAELDELMAPSLALLCEELPAKCTRWSKPVPPNQEPTPSADAQETPPVSNSMVVASAEPTNCTFVADTRPKVGDKYIVRCDGSTYLATGIYTVDHFVWSDLTPHTH